MTNHMKFNLIQALLCCAFVLYTVDLWSSLFPWLRTVKICCSIRLRRAVPLRGPYGMIGFFTVPSAVTLRWNWYRMKRVLGVELSETGMEDILRRCEHIGAQCLQVQVTRSVSWA